MESSFGQIALVHDARRFDGHYTIFLQAKEVLEQAGVRFSAYVCVDPSLANEYPRDGTVLWGRRIPLGGYAERGFNRLFPVFTRQLRGVPANVVHVSDVYLASVLRFRPDVVLTIADLAKKHTRYYPRSSSILHNFLLRYAPRARAIVTHTDWVRQDVARTLHFDPARIFLQGHCSFPPRALGEEPRWRPPSPDRPWTVLYVATDRPHKNIPFFLRVVELLGREYQGLLVTWPTAATLALARPLIERQRLRILSSVPDLLPIYRNSEILLFPSLYEGFGLPLVEAMSQGLPVIASTETCIPEVVGEAGRLLPPTDPIPWVTAVRELADEGQYRAASSRSLARAREFGAERSKRGLLAAYECAAAG